MYEALARAVPWNNFYRDFLKSKNLEEPDHNSKDEEMIKLAKEYSKAFLNHLKTVVYPEMLKTGKPTVREVFIYVESSSELQDIMYGCLEYDVEKRLTVDQIIEKLQKMKNILGEPVVEENVTNVSSDIGEDFGPYPDDKGGYS